MSAGFPALGDVDRLRLLAFGATTTGVLVTDPARPDHPIVAANPAFLAMTGYAEAEVLGRNCRFLQGPGTDPAAVARVRRAVAAGREETVTLLNYRKDGTPFWNELRITPVAGPGGSPAHFVGVQTDVTARVEAEAARRASEARFRALVEDAPDAVAVLDGTGAVRFATPSAGRILGLDPADVGAVPCVDLVHRDDAERFAAAFARVAVKPGARETLKHRVRHADGSWRWIELALRHALDDPAVGGVVANFRDVTAERDAADERDRFFDLSLDPLAVAGLDGAFRRVNSSFSRVLGWSEAELLARPFLELVHPDDLAATQAEVGRLAAGERALSFENRYRCRDGSWRWLSWDSVAEGGLIYAVARDVTDQKATTAALRAGEERLRLALEAAGLAVFAWDAEADRTDADDRLRDLVGLAPGEEFSLAAALGRFIHPDDRDRYAKAARALFDPDGDGRLTEEVRWTGTDGVPRWLAFFARAYFGDGGARGSRWPERVVGAVLDVTARKRAEDELVAAKEAAEEASLLKSAFLRTMSHELRSPLTAILGYAELLRGGFGGPLSPAQAGDIVQIVGGAERLLGLVNDVLDLSRIEAGGIELDPEDVPLRAAVADVVADLAPQAAAKGLALVADVPEGLVVRADPLRLRQVLLNLAGNAVKFTEAGEVAVAAEAVAGGVEVVVRDTGIGIPPEVLPHVFEEFRQADAGTTRKFGGSGLGLAITKRLAEMHGGTIRAESAPGVGSTFTVFLPSGGA